MTQPAQMVNVDLMNNPAQMVIVFHTYQTVQMVIDIQLNHPALMVVVVLPVLALRAIGEPIMNMDRLNTMKLGIN